MKTSRKFIKKYVNFSILVNKWNSRYLIKIKYLTMAESNPFIAEVPKSWSNVLLCKIHILSDFFLFLLFFPHFFILSKILGLCQCSVCYTDQVQLMLIHCMYYILYILFNWTNHSINLSLFTPLNFRACAWQKNPGKVLQNLSYITYTQKPKVTILFSFCAILFFPLMNDLVWPGYSLKGKNEVAQNENKNCDLGFLCI